MSDSSSKTIWQSRRAYQLHMLAKCTATLGTRLPLHLKCEIWRTASTSADPVHAPKHWKMMYSSARTTDTLAVARKAIVIAGLR